MATTNFGGIIPSESSLLRFNPYQNSPDDLSQESNNNNVSNSNSLFSTNTSVLVDVVTLSKQFVNGINPESQTGLDQNGLYSPQTIPRNSSQTNVSVDVNVNSELNIANGNGSFSLSNAVDVDVNIDIGEILRQLTGKEGDNLQGLMQTLRVNVDVNLRQSIGLIGRTLGIGNRDGMGIRGNSLNSIINLGQMRKLSRFGDIDINMIKDQMERLYNIDPKLLKDYLLILATFLDEAPEELQKFLDRIQAVLDKLGTVNEKLNEVQEIPSQPQPQSQGFSANVSTRVEVFVQQIQNGADNSINIEVNVNTEVNVGNPQKADPLIFDLNGNGIETTGAENGVDFDIDGDGKVDKTSFVSGGDAFLAIDKNGNGVIDDGKELFGDQNGSANGIEELRKYDSNKDNYIDEKDPIFNNLLLFNNNTLESLKDAGISAIKLGLIDCYKKLNSNDYVDGAIEFIRQDGSRGLVGETILGYY